MSELAAKMLEYEQVQTKADALRAEIEAAVLEIGKTQTVGNVRASYSAGRKSYDYRAAWEQRYHEWFPENEHAKTVYDYRAACKGYEINDVPYTQSEPSVTVKLLG